MLHLVPNSNNDLYLVCDDMVVEDNVIYFWRWIHDQSDKVYEIELTNFLEDNPRADLFKLNLPDDLDLDTGEYRFTVYESDTPGRTDFENMRVLHEGHAEVKTTFKPDIDYESEEGPDVIYKVS